MTYKLIITEKQSSVIREALNLYFRIHMGQWSELEYMARFGVFAHAEGKELDADDLKIVKSLLDLTKDIIFGWPPNASWGIQSPEISDDARIAADIHDVIRHQFWLDRPEGKQGYSVDSWEPTPHTDKTLPTIERCGD